MSGSANISRQMNTRLSIASLVAANFINSLSLHGCIAHSCPFYIQLSTDPHLAKYANAQLNSLYRKTYKLCKKKKLM